MGSMHNCCLTGFLCRLCSGIHKKVIHIYGREGQMLLLSQKINEYLPVTVSAADQLPKTICFDCKIQVDQHHQLIQMIKRSNETLLAAENLRSTNVDVSSTVPSVPSIQDDDKDEDTVAELINNAIVIPSSSCSSTSTSTSSSAPCSSTSSKPSI